MEMGKKRDKRDYNKFQDLTFEDFKRLGRVLDAADFHRSSN
jgi:hypothetical protein